MNLDEIERRANAATPGPWYPTPDSTHAGERRYWACSPSTPNREQYSRDSEFMRDARADVVALVARVRELEAERDQALADYQDLGRVMHEECSRLESECERLKTFAAQTFSAMVRQEAEQMREYGLSYEGVRKVLHEYNDGEISFGKLMDMIRAAARAMAEDMKK